MKSAMTDKQVYLVFGGTLVLIYALIISDRPQSKDWGFRNYYVKALLAFRTLLVGSTQQPIIKLSLTIGLTVANPKEATPSCSILIAAF